MNENTNLIDEHNEELTPIEQLSPFKRMVLSLGTLPSAFYDTMTYYESLVYFYEYLKNEVIPTVNNNGEAVEELQTKYLELKSYVDNYFDNLDVQEEINNKLDEMAEDGTLTNLIKNYVDPIYQAYEQEIDLKIGEQDVAIENLTTSVNTSVSTQNALIQQNINSINELDGRMDQFSSLTEGSTTGDAELADIRTDFTGQSYSTAGNSVRGQVNFLNDKINDINNNFDVNYEEGILANGTIQNIYNLDYVHTTNFIPNESQGYIEIKVKNFSLNENEKLIYGYSVYDSNKTAVNHISPSPTYDTGIFHLPLQTSIKYCNVVIGVYNTSTETLRSIRITDFTPNQVQIKTYKNKTYFENLNNSINNKLNKNILEQQIYLNTDSIYTFESGANGSMFFHFTSSLIFRVLYSNQFNITQILSMLSDDYKGTSPSGISNCIKIPDSYKLVLDLEDTTNKIKVISRNTTNSNQYISILENVSSKIVDGKLKYLYDSYDLYKEQIPLYWNSALNTVIGKIQTNIANTDSLFENFFFITDQHWNSNAKQSSKIIKYLGNKLQIPLVLSGGDTLNADLPSKTSAINEMEDYISSLENGYLRIFQTYGNHDNNNVIGNNPSYSLTTKQIYNSMIKQRESFTFNSPDIKVMKYDNTDKHIRYINFKLACEIGEGEELALINQVLTYISELDTSWNVILMCHCYFRGDGVFELSQLYIDKIATLEKTCDATIIGLFVGHVHDDKSTVYEASNGGKLLIISTTTDSYNQNNASASPPYTMTKGTNTEQAFDIVQIDTTNRHIYMTRVGAGNDRDFSY